MNGCPYLYLSSLRKRRGRYRTRRRAMCLAQGTQVQPCDQPVVYRGAKCHVYRVKRGEASC